MDVRTQCLTRLRESRPLDTAGISGPARASHWDEWELSGVRFAAVGGPLEQRWHQALTELAQCLRPLTSDLPVLNEGGVYWGTWIESSGTISTEVLTRFLPSVARDSHLIYTAHQRDDGLLPYKVTSDGPGFSQIQIVTPFARSVWHHYQLTDAGTTYLRTMYDAMARMDSWLARYRDTRGTGAVEAFCTFDTGHDLSPRFWNVADRGFRNDARRYDPASPILPFIAPDLTANVACQRVYLARIAEELGEDPEPWRLLAQASLTALMEQCFDAQDHIFYDKDATGSPVRVQSDVLLRVLACEVGDAELHRMGLERYLMNTAKFLGHYGFTSIAMDDPRFDRDFTRNSWAGPANFLSLIRAPAAFEHHGHVAELALAAQPMLAAVAGWDRFPQCVDAWSGNPGFTEMYSPAILWFLDAIERHCGILPRPDGELWLSGLTPSRLDHGAAAEAIAYSRIVAGVTYELVGDDDDVDIYRDGEKWLAFARGWRIVVGPDGDVVAAVCLAAAPVAGRLTVDGITIDLTLAPNDRALLADGVVTDIQRHGFVAPRS
ncbi:hypothetical protein LGT39_03195 [Demequina sp. TTPB684]|uniref:MGH1-like glycoside hydrolase domain-containing protein n=1 Tax=unclassified Demequina TaxID=2620311 RepID=UPI001CF43EF1|nr:MULTISPECIES: hypothetical protein [unclassified Demequina]MCB2411856.1 hypothetical protein [Demequina sp. TTPB684]UPU88611.1 hypothetical protein LGT36_001425 [Demequina sp. TMPB413]